MGMFGDMWNSFTGKAQQQAVGQARGELTQGYNQAAPYYDQAASVFNPYVQAGTQANTAYQNILGLNGQDAAQNAFNAYSNNPFYQGAAQQGLKNLQRVYNAKGTGNSGADRAALAYVGDQYAGQYANDVGNQARFGYQAATGQSNALRSRGDLAYNYGQDLGNNDIAAGNAKGIGLQRAFDVAALLTGGATAVGSLGYKPFGPSNALNSENSSITTRRA